MEYVRMRSLEATLRAVRLGQMGHDSKEYCVLYPNCLASFIFMPKLPVRLVDRRHVCRAKWPESQKARIL